MVSLKDWSSWKKRWRICSPLRTKLLFALFSYSVCCEAQDQPFRFISIVSADSTPLGKVTSITQDKLGFIWFIEQGNQDLVRYDGKRMVRYTVDPRDTNSLANKGLEAICADNGGNLWIGVDDGVDQFDPVRNQFEHYHFAAAFHNKSRSHSIICDREGLVWMGTENGLVSFDPKAKNFRYYQNDSADAHSIS